MINDEEIEQCIKCMKDNIHMSYENDIIIDFTAKEGNFVDKTQNLVRMSLFYDENPTHPLVQKMNFLDLDFDKFNKTYLSGLWFDDIHVIGKPHTDNIHECIEIACNFAQTISFILPKNKFKYTFPSSFKCLFKTNLDKLNDFEIWIKTDY
jgi:hypothetical protein